MQGFFVLGPDLTLKHQTQDLRHKTVMCLWYALRTRYNRANLPNLPDLVDFIHNRKN